MSDPEDLALPPSAPPEPSAPAERAGPPELGSFWRRFLALVIDALILMMIGLALGWRLSGVFTAMGDWGRLAGLAVAMLYFVSLEGPAGGGATLGKRVLRLRVVDANGATPGWGAAILRGFLLSLLFALNGYYAFGRWYDPRVLAVGLFWAAVFVSLYLAIFERRRRQCVHDILAGTFVMRNGTPWSAPGERNRVHGAVLAAWFILSGGVAWMAWRRFAPLLNPMIELRAAVASAVGTQTVGVNDNTTNFNGKVTRSLNVTVVEYADPGKAAVTDVIRRAAKATLNSRYPIDKMDGLSFAVLTGYNIGIASWWKTQGVGLPLGKWRAWLSGADPGPFPLNAPAAP